MGVAGEKMASNLEQLIISRLLLIIECSHIGIHFAIKIIFEEKDEFNKLHFN